jgi:hypothetical protein
MILLPEKDGAAISALLDACAPGLDAFDHTGPGDCYLLLAKQLLDAGEIAAVIHDGASNARDAERYPDSWLIIQRCVVRENGCRVMRAQGPSIEQLRALIAKR